MPKYYRRPRRLTRAEKILAKKQGIEAKGLLVRYDGEEILVLMDPKNGTTTEIKKRKER